MNVKIIVLILIITLNVAVSLSAEMWYVQDFDNLEDGFLTGQDEWAGAGTIQDEFFRGNSGKSVNVTGEISRNLLDHEDVQYITFYLMLTEEANMDWKLYMGDGARTQAAAMGLNPDNQTIHIHGGDEQIPVDIKPEEWYQLGAVLDFNSKTWKLYFNDMENPLREGKPFRNAGVATLANIWLNVWAVPSAGKLYVDDFMIGDGDVIPTSSGPEQALESVNSLAALWGKIRKEG